jgi:hypothetical protein
LPGISLAITATGLWEESSSAWRSFLTDLLYFRLSAVCPGVKACEYQF